MRTIVEISDDHDLALIKIDATGLSPAVIGDSDALQVGQTAIAIGSPLGTFTETVTRGIISGTGRTITVGDDEHRPPGHDDRTCSRPTRRSTRATAAARSSTPRAP